jgi:hypothetical protein
MHWSGNSVATFADDRGAGRMLAFWWSSCGLAAFRQHSKGIDSVFLHA